MIKLVKKRTHTLNYLFICGLFVFFCSISVLLITIGVKQYHSITKQALNNQNLRTVSSYLTEKFQQHDSADAISFTESNGISLISFVNTDKENPSITYIYVYDGYLREFRQHADSDFILEQGTPIAKLQDLEWLAYSNNLYRFTLTDPSGDVSPIYISWNAK